jgi:hypothetical protein
MWTQEYRLSLGGTNFKATPGVKIISPAGAKRCIVSNYSNPFSSPFTIKQGQTNYNHIGQMMTAILMPQPVKAIHQPH